MTTKTESNVSPPVVKKIRRYWRLFYVAGLFLLLCINFLIIYLNSNSFRETVRRRVIADLERMTGGKVELQSFTWELTTLHFEAHNLTIHGREAANEIPYAHADRVDVGVKIVSFFTRKISLENVTLDGFVVHLMVYPDGSTNQPSPPASSSASNEKVSAKNLFDLAVKQVAVNNGTLMLNQERIPFSLSGKDISAGMSYVAGEHAYQGHLDLAPLTVTYSNAAPLPAEVHMNFLLRAKEAQIKSLKLSTKKSQLETEGTLSNYTNPALALEYQASLDLAEVADALKIAPLHAGRADLKGAASYQNKRYASQGNLNVRDLEWHEAAAHFDGINFASPFTFTPEKIILPRLNAQVLGGSAQGNAEIINWNPAPSKKNQQRGTARFHLEGVQISRVAAAVSTRKMPLDKIELAGKISVDINSSWIGCLQKATSELKLESAPPVNPTSKEVPVTAQLQATYHGDLRTLDVAGLTLATRAIRVNATGELGSDKAQARLSVNATDLRELQPALNALDPGTRIPLDLEGRSSFNGTVFGKLEAMSARGRIELETFDSEFRLSQAANQPGKPARLHWDALTSDLDYSPSRLLLQHGTLRRGAAQLGFSTAITLHQGEFDERTSQFNATLHVQNENIGDMQTLAGTEYPLTGFVNADMQVAGTLHNLRGGGKLQITKLTAYGEPFKSFTSDFRLNGSETDLENISLAHNGARVTGSFAYDLDSKNYRFDLTGANIDFATLQRLEFPRLAIEGQAGFHVNGSGTEDAPVINGQLDLRNLVLNHETVGSLSVLAETHGEEVTLRGRSNFDNAELNVDGKVKLRDDWPGQIALKFSHLDFDPLIRAYFQGQITGHSSLAGEVDIRGLMKRPHSLAITGNFSQLSANLENVNLQNNGPIHFAEDNETLKLDEFHMTGTETDLSAKGSIQLSGDYALDLQSKGRFNLKLLHLLNPDLVANGPATFTVNITGAPRNPQLSGRLELNDASASFVDLPNGLSHINGSMLFVQDRMQIEKLTAHTGGGDLNVSGFLGYRGGPYFDLTATGSGVRLRYPPGVSSSADARLRYTGSAKSSLLTGDIVVNRFGMNPHFDFANYLAQSKKAPIISTLNPFLDNMHLDLHVTSTPHLRVETSLAKLSGDLDLHVRGTAARPAIVGRVNIAEGDIFFNGTKYRLERGDITFSNPLSIEPVVNIDMSARVQDYDITIGLHGQATNSKGLSMTYRSDPPLSNADIIALLAFGRTRGQDVYNASQPGQSTSTNDTATASNAILGEALNATFSDRVQRLFGASRVKIDPQFIGSENNPSARVTIEQTINNNITFTYVTSLTQSAETVIQVEYNIDKNVSIVAVRDQNGVLGFDVHIRHRKK